MMKMTCFASSLLLCLLVFASCNTGNNPHIPVLSVDPPSLNFRGTETLKTLNIVNKGGGSLTWEIDNDTVWIICSLSSGETETETTVDICVNGKEIGDPDQASEGVLTILSNGGDYTVSVYYVPAFTLTGFVYERSAPGVVPLPDARVTLYSGDSDFSNTSGQDGSYILEDVPKSFDYVEVLKEGYNPTGIPPDTKLVIPDNNILEYDFYLSSQ
jgi:hypothetical protein